VIRADGATAVTLVCPGGLAGLLGCDSAGAGHLAVNGKCTRGSLSASANRSLMSSVERASAVSSTAWESGRGQ
jgi:hypothetical protein